MSTIWRIFCKYDKYQHVVGHEDLHKCWLAEGLVTIGWPPEYDFALTGPPAPTQTGAWNWVRERLVKNKEGGLYFLSLTGAPGGENRGGCK